MKPRTRATLPTSLVNQLREQIHYSWYSLLTEETYVYKVKKVIRFHKMRHLRKMGESEVIAYFGYLAMVRRVSAKCLFFSNAWP